MNEMPFRNNLLLISSEKMMKAADCDKTFVRTLVLQIRRHILHNISIIHQILTPNSFSIRTSSLYRRYELQATSPVDLSLMISG